MVTLKGDILLSIIAHYGDHNINKSASHAISHGNIWKFIYNEKLKEYIPHNAIRLAINNCQLDMIKYLYSIGIKITINDSTRALECNELKIVKYLHSINTEFLLYAIDIVARRDYLELTMFLHSNGYTCSPYTMDYAMNRKCLNVIRFLRSIGVN